MSGRGWLIVALLVAGFIYVFQPDEPSTLGPDARRVEAPSVRERTIPGQARGATTGYLLEDGDVAWRPMTALDKFVVNVLSLGQTVGSEMVYGRRLDTADPDSFRVIAGAYGADRAHVWLEGNMIAGADPATFKVLARGFSQDKAQLFQATWPVMNVSDAANIKVFSSSIVTVDDATWLISDPLIALPERPRREPDHFCRLWFSMNDAIWLGDEKRFDLEAANSFGVINCDGGIHRRFVDGVPEEVLSTNDGLLFHTDEAIWRLRLSGETEKITDLPEPIVHIEMMSSGVSANPFLLVQDASGMVSAIGLTEGAVVQTLGRFDSLPDRSGPYIYNAFWLDDTFFTKTSKSETPDQFVINRGVAERLGRYAHVGDFLYDGAMLLAVPGDLPLRLVGKDTLLIGDACINYGRYVTDLRDPHGADEREVGEQCDVHRRPDSILYDGLQIAFIPQLVGLGPNTKNPLATTYDLGRITITNTSDAIYELPARFLADFELKVDGTPIAPPDDAWPPQGVQLAPSESYSWQLKAHSAADPTFWSWVLKMRHTDERLMIFGDEPFDVGMGQFFGGD